MAEAGQTTLSQLLKEQDAIQQKIQASVQTELDAIQVRLDALASIGKHYRLVAIGSSTGKGPAARGRRTRSSSEEKDWIDSQIRGGKRNKEIMVAYKEQFGRELKGYSVANRRAKLKA